ncbi:hypothetical protein ACTA71_001394 [Dictyostelium dimigraforme]
MDNSVLFFKIWKNNVIKNEILFHLRLYNVHFNQESVFTIKELSNYKYKNYLNRIVIDGKDMNGSDVEEITEPFPYGISRIIFSHFSLKHLKFYETTIPTTVVEFHFWYCEINKANLLPPGVKHIKINGGSLKKDVLPNSIETIEFDGYDLPLEKGDLPSSVTSLSFGYGFNQSLAGNWLPPNIKSLKFSNDGFNQPIEEIERYLPKSLTCLDLPKGYNGHGLKIFNQDYFDYLEFKKNLANGKIESQSINYTFNQPIEKKVLPNSLTTLSFGDEFNQPIEKEVLPNSLTTLSFGFYFNQPIKKGTLPNSLKTLSFGNSFNQSIEKCVLPNNLTTLSFGDYFEQSIKKGALPNNLKSLSFGWYFNQPIEKGDLPNNLTTLSFGDSFGHPIKKEFFTNKLTTLELGGCFDEPIEKGYLPNSLTSLSFGSNFNQTLKKCVLPNSLTTLSFGYYYNQPFEKDVLPNSLTTLSFGYSFDQPFGKEVLPNNLKTLELDYIFNQPIEKEVLPNSLTTLSFGNCFNQPIEKEVLPNNLTSLSFGNCFNQPIEKEVLPNNLTTLTLDGEFGHQLKGVLPNSLKSLEILSSTFKQDFSFDDCHNLEFIIIKGNNYQLINNLNSNVFTKYIKLKNNLY